MGKEKTELISVLMPVYNVKAYVEEAVNSVLNQTYKNIELVIVDDASTDGTYEVLLDLQKKDSRICLYHNELNSKICKTLNKALKYAKGKLIARMDGDDISVPRRLEVLKGYLDSHPDISLVGSWNIAIDEMGRCISPKKYPCGNIAIKKGNKFMSSVSHFWMARYEVYKELNGYRNIPYAEDYDFLLRGEINGYKYANVAQYLYKMRIRQGNTVSSNGLVQRKTFYYVRKLHKKEVSTRKDCFSEEDLKAAVKCTDAQKDRYNKSAEYLNAAVMNKANKTFLIINALRAAMGSQYIFRYLVSSVRFRMLISKESRMISRIKHLGK